MELKFESLNIHGFNNQAVPNTLITHPTPSNHLVVVLPGYRYPAEMPPLHYVDQILLARGVDSLHVDYTYFRSDFYQHPQNAQDQWISTDVFAACNAALSQHSYENITLVGKSLGTIAMGHLLADARFQKVTCIWMTPILTADWLCARIEQVHPRSLFIIGTADQFYRPDILKRLEQVTNGQSVVLEGVTHSLEIPGDIPKSLAVLNQIVQACQKFLGESV